jgi:hypothetical protein
LKNTLGDLNNHLFAQLERLNDEDLTGDKLAEEIRRTEAVTDVASQIIANGALVLKARVAYEDNLSADKTDRPKMLEG